MVDTQARFGIDEVYIDLLQKTALAWKASGEIDGEEVDLAQAIILLCGRLRELPDTVDRVAMAHELQEANRAFLAKDFPGAKYHMLQADKWRDAITAK